MSALDSDELISQALKRVGNEVITADAQVWIYNVLDRLYEDFSWPFLEKLTTGNLTSGQSSVSLPADFDSPWDKNSFVLIDSNGGYHALAFATGYDQDFLANPATTGTPSQALIDLGAETWRPYPLPDTAYTWQIRYKKKVTRPGTYATFTPEFPNDDIIIQALFVTALQHEDDDRYVPENQMLRQMIARYKAKFNLQAQRSPKVRLASRFSAPVNFR